MEGGSCFNCPAFCTYCDSRKPEISCILGFSVEGVKPAFAVEPEIHANVPLLFSVKLADVQDPSNRKTLIFNLKLSQNAGELLEEPPGFDLDLTQFEGMVFTEEDLGDFGSPLILEPREYIQTVSFRSTDSLMRIDNTIQILVELKGAEKLKTLEMKFKIEHSEITKYEGELGHLLIEKKTETIVLENPTYQEDTDKLSI